MEVVVVVVVDDGDVVVVDDDDDDDVDDGDDDCFSWIFVGETSRSKYGGPHLHKLSR